LFNIILICPNLMLILFIHVYYALNKVFLIFLQTKEIIYNMDGRFYIFFLLLTTGMIFVHFFNTQKNVIDILNAGIICKNYTILSRADTNNIYLEVYL
jgi:hypothetical protein